MRYCSLLALLYLIGGWGFTDEPRAPAIGDAIIRGKFGPSEIVITTTERLAGAIHSLTWNGKEFIDSYDQGRQLQSACSFDKEYSEDFWAERFNPTEAGSRLDGTGNTSSSKLLRLKAAGNELQATTQMAFWLAPGEKSSGRLALNDRLLSEYTLSKRIRIGHEQLANVIEYDVVFHVPPGPRHNFAQFEALTGYMPPEFSNFWRLRANSSNVEELNDGPGEQEFPVILSNAAGSHAMGVYSPDQPSLGHEKAGYGRFRFVAERVVKWNCVFRVSNAEGLPAGEYRFRLFVAVGTLDDVRQGLAALRRRSELR
jgi:hypothetical protein